MCEEVLTLDILDKALAKIHEYEKDNYPTEMWLNPNDWRKAVESMKWLSGNAAFPSDTCMGIPVKEHPELPEGVMILQFKNQPPLQITRPQRLKIELPPCCQPDSDCAEEIRKGNPPPCKK